MFKFMKKHAVVITVSVGALVAAAIGFTWFRPGLVGGAIQSAGNMITGFGGTVVRFFRRAPSPVDVAAAGMGPEAAAV
jgi:hypothetical protein